MKIESFKTNNFRLLFITIICIFVTALSIAYYTEYVLGLVPCPLCIYQRLACFALIILSIIGLLIKKASNYNIILVMLTLFTASTLAAYHTGVEHEVFQATEQCSGFVKIPDDLSISDIQKMLYNESGASCTRPAIKIIGLSMTEWNLLLNLFILIAVVRIFNAKT